MDITGLGFGFFIIIVGLVFFALFFLTWGKLDINRENKEIKVKVTPWDTCVKTKDKTSTSIEEKCKSSADSPVFEGKKGVLYAVRGLIFSGIVLIIMFIIGLYFVSKIGRYDERTVINVSYGLLALGGLSISTAAVLWLVKLRKLKDLDGKETKYDYQFSPFVEIASGLVLAGWSYYKVFVSQ